MLKKRHFHHKWLTIAGLIILSTSSLSAAEPSPTKDRWDHGDFSNWKNRPNEPFRQGKETFDHVKSVLLKNYVDKGLTEDDLYRAAVQGMLSNIDPNLSAWNRLMSPTEYAELVSDIDGNIVGVGVEISFDKLTGNTNVVGVVPGTVGAKSGIKRGDQILKIDGQSFRGNQLRDVVYAIRGKAGTSVVLTLLHDDQVKKVTLKREKLSWDTVDAVTLDDHIGLMTIKYFTSNTPKLLKSKLEQLKSQGTKRLIIDLRGNEGGVFDRTIECINLLIPKGRLIVGANKRGLATEKIMSTEDPVITDMPIAVLINDDTKSGAEIMAAALKHNAGATTVGQHTFGKWSVQKVEELNNKFAIKYTTARFTGPDGTDLSGKGLSADIPVDFPNERAAKLQAEKDIKARLSQDPQLEAALNIIKLK